MIILKRPLQRSKSIYMLMINLFQHKKQMNRTESLVFSPENLTFKNQLSMLSGRYNTLTLCGSTDLNAYNIFSRFEKIFNHMEQNEIIECVKSDTAMYHFNKYFSDEDVDHSILGNIPGFLYYMMQYLNCFNIVYNMNPHNLGTLIRRFPHTSREYRDKLSNLCVLYHEGPNTTLYDQIFAMVVP